MNATNRIVTTAELRSMHDTLDDQMLVPAGLINELDPDGIHVIVPYGEVATPVGPRLLCTVLLATDDNGPALAMAVMVSPDRYEQFPTAFDALRCATKLVPLTIDHLEHSVDEFLGEQGDGV